MDQMVVEGGASFTSGNKNVRDGGKAPPGGDYPGTNNSGGSFDGSSFVTGYGGGDGGGDLRGKGGGNESGQDGAGLQGGNGGYCGGGGGNGRNESVNGGGGNGGGANFGGGFGSGGGGSDYVGAGGGFGGGGGGGAYIGGGGGFGAGGGGGAYSSIAAQGGRYGGDGGLVEKEGEEELVLVEPFSSVIQLFVSSKTTSISQVILFLEEKMEVEVSLAKVMLPKSFSSGKPK